MLFGTFKDKQNLFVAPLTQTLDIMQKISLIFLLLSEKRAGCLCQECKLYSKIRGTISGKYKQTEDFSNQKRRNSLVKENLVDIRAYT